MRSLKKHCSLLYFNSKESKKQFFCVLKCIEANNIVVHVLKKNLNGNVSVGSINNTRLSLHPDIMRL